MLDENVTWFLVVCLTCTATSFWRAPALYTTRHLMDVAAIGANATWHTNLLLTHVLDEQFKFMYMASHVTLFTMSYAACTLHAAGCTCECRRRLPCTKAWNYKDWSSCLWLLLHVNMLIMNSTLYSYVCANNRPNDASGPCFAWTGFGPGKLI